MFDRLTLITAPTSDALELADVKAHLRVDGTDEDTLISSLIEDATAMIDGPDGIGYAMMSQTWRLDLDEFPEAIRIPMRPVTSVSSIAYLDGDGNTQTLSGSVYRTSISGGLAVIEPALGQAWPATADLRGAVSVTFVAGSGVPKPLRRAMFLMIADWFENRVGATERALAVNPAVAFALDRFRLGHVQA